MIKMEKKNKRKNKKKKKKKERPYYLRHTIFILFFLCFAFVLKKYPNVFFDALSIRVTKNQRASNRNVGVVFKILSEELPGKCENSEEDLFPFNRDRSHHPPGKPDMICYPETVEEVQTIVKVCNDKNVIIIPMGFNSALEGQTIAYDGGVIVNVMKMKKIVVFYEDDFQITVEPGLRISEVNDYLEEKGYFFSVSPGSNPSVGGAVSTRASGTLTPKYATMKENVVNLEVVLPNGEIITTRSRAVKSAAGYDLTNLFIGSEGTLGIVTKITMKVHAKPAVLTAAVVTFDSLEDAAKTVIGIKQNGINGVARMEIVNAEGILAFNKHFGTNHVPKPCLFLEFHGMFEEEVQKAAKAAGVIAKENGGSDYSFTSDETERKNLWDLRNNAYFAASRYRKDECPNCRLFSTDICVPISQFARVIAETEKDLKDNGLVSPIVGHSADGNFHCLIPIDFSNESEVKVLEKCNKKLVDRAISAGGTCTGEHGIGAGKKYALVKELGKTAVEMMKKIKLAVDPKNMMNPGKIFD